MSGPGDDAVDGGRGPKARASRRTATGPRLSAIVIGGGIAGLATAALLARDGHSVTLLEAQDSVGGRVGSWESQGFRFDTGPSWYLMPEVFEHFFQLLGTSSAEQLDLGRLDPGYRVYFEGHREPLDVAASRAGNVALFESVEPGAGAALEKYLDSAKETYGLAVKYFLYTTFQRIRPLMVGEVLRRTGRLVRLLTQSLDRFAAKRFSSPRLRKILGYPAVFLGSSPFVAPSMYHLMSYLDMEDGVLYPRGGFRVLIERIEALARAEGVDILTSSPVTAILTAPPAPGTPRGTLPRAVGVSYRDAAGDEHELAADLVVSAADLHHSETELLPADLQSYPEKWWDTRTPGPGAVLALLGVTGELPELEHHTLFFTEDWKSNFDKIFGRPSSVPDPASLYVCRPSASDDSVAPEGHENLFILVPIPADPSIGSGGIEGEGDRLIEEAADRAIAQIAEMAGIPDLAERVVVRRTLGPGDFADELNTWRGTALGPAHTLTQSALFRGRNRSAKVDGLLYAGGSTIPGIGLPMCLISAELVLKTLHDDASTGPGPVPLAPRGRPRPQPRETVAP